MKEVFYMNAKQVLFVVPDDNDPHMGILIDMTMLSAPSAVASLKPMKFSLFRPMTPG